MDSSYQFYCRNYTYKACEFECFLNKSREQCGCIPWNYPDISGGKADICHWNSLACHEKAMLNVSFEIFVTKNNNIKELALWQANILKTCSCPEDCEKITYSVTSMFHPIGDFLKAKNDNVTKFFQESRYGVWYPEMLQQFVVPKMDLRDIEKWAYIYKKW